MSRICNLIVTIFVCFKLHVSPICNYHLPFEDFRYNIAGTKKMFNVNLTSICGSFIAYHLFNQGKNLPQNKIIFIINNLEQ